MSSRAREIRSIRQVRKRDGRLVDFDESKIADAIYRAALSVGGEDRFLSEELASVVTLFLEKAHTGSIPTIEDVQDMVEKVLIETGHARTAKSYILYRERRATEREAERVARAPAQRDLFEPGPVTVLDEVAERSSPSSRERLARSLAVETGLSAETALEVAGAALERMTSLGLRQVRRSLLDRFLDAELVSRGLLRALESRGGAGPASARIGLALFPKGGAERGSPCSRAAAAVLGPYSLTAVYPEEVAAAHMSGRLFLHGLENPTAAYCASFSPEALRAYGMPGVGGRFHPRAVRSARRFSAWLGRAVRTLSAHVTDGVSLARTNLLLAPYLEGADRGSSREEAWQLLTELAGIPDVELELVLGPGSLLASRKVRGVDGGILPETYARYEGLSLALAEALFVVRGTEEGLGRRSDLPRLTLSVGRGAWSDPALSAVLQRAVREALAREPVLFLFDRRDLPVLGTCRVRSRPGDPVRLTDPAALALVVAARVTLNLPHAAYRAGRGNMGGFLADLESATALAIDGIRARVRFLERAAAPGGPLELFARGRGGSAPLFDMERMNASLAVTGLNEAVAFAAGQELHESDEALKAAQKVLSLLGHRASSASDQRLTIGVDAEDDPEVAARFARLDQESALGVTRPVPSAYTPGLALRADAPVDLAGRLMAESRLGRMIRTSTLGCTFGAGEHPAPSSVTALLQKTFENTDAHQLLLGRR